MRKFVFAAALVSLGASLSGAQDSGAQGSGPLDSGTQHLEAPILARYQAGDRVGADRLLATRAGATTFDQTQGAKLSAVFKSRAAGLTIRVERQGAKGPLLVALPPGILARARVKKRHDPLPQDLLLIRPSLLSLAPGQRSAEVTLPVACAAFRRDGPQPGVVYALERLKPGSSLDRLALALCARRAVPASLDPALALAVWIAHEDLGYERLAGSSLGFRTFRTPRQRVGAEHGPAAAALLHEAGLDLGGFDFYRAGGAKARGALPLKPAKKSTTKASAKSAGEGKGKGEGKVQP